MDAISNSQKQLVDIVAAEFLWNGKFCVSRGKRWRSVAAKLATLPTMYLLDNALVDFPSQAVSIVLSLSVASKKA